MMIIELTVYRDFWQNTLFQEYEAIDIVNITSSFNYHFMQLFYSLNKCIRLLENKKCISAIEADVKNSIRNFKRFYDNLSTYAKSFLEDVKFNNLSWRLFDILDSQFDEKLLYLSRAAIRAFYWRNKKQLQSLSPGIMIKNELCNLIIEFTKYSVNDGGFPLYRNNPNGIKKIRDCFGSTADILISKIYPDIHSLTQNVPYYNKDCINAIGINILCQIVNSMDNLIALTLSSKDKSTANHAAILILEPSISYTIEKLNQCGHIKRMFTDATTRQQSINQLSALSSDVRVKFLRAINSTALYEDALNVDKTLRDAAENSSDNSSNPSVPNNVGIVSQSIFKPRIAETQDDLQTQIYNPEVLN